ncbi:MAG: hypothetical protein ACTSPV_05195 [Candidatus Hodarchaeales archaeon]
MIVKRRERTEGGFDNRRFHLELVEPEEKREYLKKVYGQPKERYYYWEIVPGKGLCQLGSADGYDSIEELKEDRKYSMKEIEKGNVAGYIMKAEIVEEIK